MKIVFLCSEYPPAVTGGIGTFTRGLAEALVSKGNEAYVVGLYGIGETIREEVNNVHVVRLSAASGRRALVANRMRVWSELRRISRTVGPIDIFEAPDFEGAAAGLPRCSRARVVRLHGSHRYFSDERQVRHSSSVSFFEKLALRQADAIVSVSDYTARRTQALFGLSQPIITIHNAVNVPNCFSRKRDYTEVRRAVYFGTLSEKKGVLPLASAWRRFIEKNAGWRLSVIGRDTLLHGTSIRSRMVEELGEAVHSVDFEGFVPSEQILQRLSQFDFAVLPSYSESFGLVSLEAMAVGLPVIFTALSSGPEIIDHGRDGWLCDPRSVEDLTEKIEQAAASATERERIGRNARRTAEERFSYERFMQRNLDFYNEVLQQRGIR